MDVIVGHCSTCFHFRVLKRFLCVNIGLAFSISCSSLFEDAKQVLALEVSTNMSGYF